MIRLGLPRDERWLDLPDGVRVRVRPLTTAVYQAAVATAQRQSLELSEDLGIIDRVGGRVIDLPNAGQAKEMISGLSYQFMVQALAIHAITAWEGVGDASGNNIAPVNENNIICFVRDFPLIASAFLTKYAEPHEDVSAEGNGSGASQSGTLPEAPDTVADASPTVEAAAITS